VKVSLFQDIEDPIHPRADDAALDIARIFTEAGVRGSFCVTGEKCRKLIERGRRDVIEALKPHCLGLHTDTHSYHPTTMELLADVSYDRGSELAYAAERKGYQAFVRAFGRAPSFWGGAGNTWSPEITEALYRLEIPAYAYALTEAPYLLPHRFNGVLAFSQHLSISETDWADDARAQAKGSSVIEELDRRAGAHLSIFTGHPTRFRYERFWDVPYAGGVTPSTPELTAPVSDDSYERAQRNLAAWLRQVRDAAEVVGLDDAIALPWTFRRPLKEEREYFADRTAQNLREAAYWPIHRPDLSVENIVEKTLALSGTLEIAEL